MFQQVSVEQLLPVAAACFTHDEGGGAAPVLLYYLVVKHNCTALTNMKSN